MEKKFEGGYIKYKNPNYAEAQILYGEIGLGIDLGDKESRNVDLILLGRFIKAMEPLIEEIKIDGIKNYEQLLNSTEYASYLSDIAGELMTRMLNFSTEKKTDLEI